jgi:hypothetical protein
MFEARGASGMSAAQLTVAVVSSGLGFVLADALDRFLATYDPASPTKPTDKFTSDGTGTLANTLNVASSPHWTRIAAGVGMTALPAIASMYGGPMVRSSLEGMAIGSGVKLFSLLWNNVLMPMLKPKDPMAMQKSIIARLYPAEVAAALNMQSHTIAAPPGTAFGALSGAQETGVGAPADVGPFALSGDSPYADAAQALRQQAGVQDRYPSLENTWGTGGPGSDFPTAAQVMTGTAAGPQPIATEVTSYTPGPPPGPGPGPQAAPHTDPACGCIGENNQFLGFIGDAQEDSLVALNGTQR